MKMVFNKIEEAINDIKRGKMVIVVDDEGRENEGDIVIAAEKATGDRINFMITHGKGLVCMPIVGERLDELEIPQMVNHDDINRCKFTLSVDHKSETTTGISPSDRAATILSMINPASKPEDFVRPGHLFPLKYHEGGVLERQGHTEASVDLARLAGLYPAAVICEVINEDGTMSKLDDLIEFSKKHNNMKIISIEDLVAYMKNQKVIKEPEQSIVNG
jgi:3,4-dihydroxy 2-butanone 4-phosphate synthase/GTP cyclohydrolase II